MKICGDRQIIESMDILIDRLKKIDVKIHVYIFVDRHIDIGS